MKNQKLHKGNILEKAVRNSGYSITKVAERLCITRTTLYNKFKESEITTDFIIRVGSAIWYNFSVDFPELSEVIQQVNERRPRVEENKLNLLELEKKYSDLLEKYNQLTSLLVNVTN